MIDMIDTHMMHTLYVNICINYFICIFYGLLCCCIYKYDYSYQ